jgi:hypothetical protein
MLKINSIFARKFVEIVFCKLYRDKIFNKKDRQKVIRSIRKYVENLITFMGNSIYWVRYETINGETLGKKHREYCENGVYEELHNWVLSLYFSINNTNKLKYQLVDTSFIPNKYCIECTENNPHYGNKKGLKILAVTDRHGVAFMYAIVQGSMSDITSFIEIIDRIKNDKYASSDISFFLADKGYDSDNIRQKLKEIGYDPLIPHNKRNIKDKTKLVHFSSSEKMHYKNRVFVEHQFSWLFHFPVLEQVFERSIKSYMGLLLLGSSINTYKKHIMEKYPPTKKEQAKRKKKNDAKKARRNEIIKNLDEKLKRKKEKKELRELKKKEKKEKQDNILKLNSNKIIKKINIAINKISKNKKIYTKQELFDIFEKCNLKINDELPKIIV